MKKRLSRELTARDGARIEVQRLQDKGVWGDERVIGEASVGVCMEFQSTREAWNQAYRKVILGRGNGIDKEWFWNKNM